MVTPMMNLLGGIAKGFTESGVGEDITKGLLATEHIKASQETRGLARESFEQQKKSAAENIALQRQKFIGDKIFPMIEALRSSRATAQELINNGIAVDMSALDQQEEKISDFVKKFSGQGMSDVPFDSFLFTATRSALPVQQQFGVTGNPAVDSANLIARLKNPEIAKRQDEEVFNLKLVDAARKNMAQIQATGEPLFKTNAAFQAHMGRYATMLKPDHYRLIEGLTPPEFAEDVAKAEAIEQIKQRIQNSPEALAADLKKYAAKQKIELENTAGFQALQALSDLRQNKEVTGPLADLTEEELVNKALGDVTLNKVMAAILAPALKETQAKQPIGAPQGKPKTIRETQAAAKPAGPGGTFNADEVEQAMKVKGITDKAQLENTLKFFLDTEQITPETANELARRFGLTPEAQPEKKGLVEKFKGFIFGPGKGPQPSPLPPPP